ncbi:hypothetical protein RSAG8_12264, partial [Rhizoctonia solani AG-8 WAC10335]
MESLQPAANTQPPAPDPNLNIPLDDLYQLCDRDAWAYHDVLLIAAARVAYAAVHGHFEIGIDRVLKKNPRTGEMEPDFVNYTFTCTHNPAHCRMRKRKRSPPAVKAPRTL